jgi:hypothetical protein
MAQRLEPLSKTDKGYKEYLAKLALWHKLLFYAMKSKQATDLEYIEKMRTVVGELEPLSLSGL